MSSSAVTCATVILDAEEFRLDTPPNPRSRIVRTAREDLLCELDISTLAEDLGRVSHLLLLARTSLQGSSSSSAANLLSDEIGKLTVKCRSLFDATSLALAKFRVAAEAVLEELPLNHSLFSSGDISTATCNLLSNDDLARELSSASRALSAQLSSAADDTSITLSAALREASRHDRAARSANSRAAALRVEHASAWAAHNALLESMTEAGRLYAEAAAKERRAERRARVFSVFEFTHYIDSFFGTYFRVRPLSPICEFLRGVQSAATQARAETRLLMDAKRRQRALNRSALDEIAKCSREMQQVKSEADAANATVRALRAVATELKRMAAAVMRVAAFWSQLGASAGRLSAAEYVALVKALSEEEEIESREDFSCMQGVWMPPGMIRRRHVTYYAKWVALADVCAECEEDVRTARDAAHEAARGMNIRAESPQHARDMVADLAARLEKELSEIDEEIERFRTRTTRNSPRSSSSSGVAGLSNSCGESAG